MPEHLGVLGHALKTSPDFVRLPLYINDLETKQMQRPQPHSLLPAAFDRPLERSSVLDDPMNQEWAALQPHLGLVDSYEEYMAKNLHDPSVPNSQIAFGMLNRLIENANRAGAACGIVALTCTHQRIGCLDLLPAFSAIADPRTMWVSPFDAHPNAMANQRAAREILLQFRAGWRRQIG